MTTTLLGKSAKGARHLSLLQHLEDTAVAATHVFRAGTRQAERYLAFFKIPASEHSRFLLHLQVAALFHDVGKANDEFQAMVRHKAVRQSLRHEHLSALLLCEPAMRLWLESAAIDVDVITAAVLSHHLKASGQDGDWRVLQARSATPTILRFDDPQIATALRRVANLVGLQDPPPAFPATSFAHQAWTPAFEALFQHAALFSRQRTQNLPRWNFLLAVKAGLIIADSVASGLWREDHDLERWINDVLHRSAITADDIERDVLEKRIKELGPKWTGWHGFQEGASNIGRRGLLLAACGAGKTLAAWRWAHAIAAKEPIGRVIFLYPTRGTATEGFRDYVAHAPEGEVALVHGTSAYELQGMQENPSDSMKDKSFVDEGAARLFSLGLWDKRYFSATVDQFLGFIEHSYGGLCLLPALADAAVVFDEVHSYDPRMWNALVTFLQRFDIPVLCMTATLPPTRRQTLTEACGLLAYPTSTDMLALDDLEANETHPRYRITATTKDAALESAIEAVRAGQRVLWVVNTVRRCQQLARQLRDRLKLTVGVYHSRFRLMDRQQRHRDTSTRRSASRAIFASASTVNAPPNDPAQGPALND